LDDPVAVTLEEPNVLLLDQAEWQWNDEGWQPREEVLRIDNRIRERFDLPTRMASVAQPWAVREPDEPLGKLTLRFRFTSEVDATGVELALEQPERCAPAFDGAEVSVRDIGWYVDESIRCIPLPDISVGEHELVVQIAFSRTTDVEACYLLGDFGVRVAGRHAVLTEPVLELAFGDITTQGLPFYGGNLVYHCCYHELADLEDPVLAFGDFAAPLLAVRSGEGEWQRVAFAPFEAHLAAGTIDIKAFGNRHNTFASLHNIDRDTQWFGPDYWRSTGRQWAYEYQLKPAGVLTAPMICTYRSLGGEDGFVLRTRH
jgi:hypothetical protein